jgi:hypothetical protein
LLEISAASNYKELREPSDLAVGISFSTDFSDDVGEFVEGGFEV